MKKPQPKTNKKYVVKAVVTDYEDQWLNRLAIVCHCFERMGYVEKLAALRFLGTRYHYLAEEKK